MNSKEQKELILSLIKDDLINLKLVYGLEEIGLTAGDYLLHLSTTIFKLIGIAETWANEFIYEKYLALSEQVKQIDISQSHNNLNALAEEMYEYLLQEKAKL